MRQTLLPLLQAGGWGKMLPSVSGGNKEIYHACVIE